MNGAVKEVTLFQEEALQLHRKVGVRHARGECLCKEGHLQRVADLPADDALDEARGIADGISISSTGDLSRAGARLERASESRGRGEVLVYGPYPADFPGAAQTRLNNPTC